MITLLAILVLSSLAISQAKKMTHIYFYWQDVSSGANATTALVAKASNKSTASSFGSITIIDDKLTSKPALNSTEIGRAQGMYISSTLASSEAAVTMVMNFVFTRGKYNGSTLSILGHNALLRDTREMPVIGGTKYFRFASGYALLSTYSIGIYGDANVKYDVYVLH
jgi:hypothetical protein